MSINGHIPRRQFLQLSAGIAASAGLPRRVFDVLDFGAKGDGNTLNTEAFQRAIDHAGVAGGGTVWVSSGEFLTGGLVLRSCVTLHLDAGAILRGSTRVEDYQYHPGPPEEGDANGRHLLFAIDADDIAITGQGTIDGSGPAFWSKK